MSLKMWMPSFLRRKRFVRSMREAEYPVEKAFSYRGQDYFRFVDPSNVPAGRMLAAMKYYLPLTTQCDADYLKWHCQALNEILSNPKSINLQRVLQLVLHMEERLSWIPSPADVYKYAAVLYMDETENPYTFDEEYAEKKIARWREDPNGPLAFFDRAYFEISAVFEKGRHIAKDLFDGQGGKRGAAVEDSVASVIYKSELRRRRFENTITDFNLEALRLLRRLPTDEYFLIAQELLKRLKKQDQELKKLKRR